MADTAVVLPSDETTPLLGETAVEAQRRASTAASLRRASFLSARRVSSARRASSSTAVFTDEEAQEQRAGQDDDSDSEATKQLGGKAVASIIASMLIGLFIANADGSLVMATYPLIASEFQQLSDASWIVTSYSIAMCASLGIYGKLSDIYGRKPILIISYSIFGLGCVLIGIAPSLSFVIFGRVIAGIGGAGLSAMVSIIITDLVPLRSVATWRSYTNVAATTGRSLGGPVGGWLADTIGWRWSFLGQAPFMILSILLTLYLLPSGLGIGNPSSAKGSSLKRIDFTGAALLGLTIITFLLPTQLGGTKMPWMDARIFAGFGLSVVFGWLFWTCEKKWAKEPIFPLSLLTHRDVITSYLAMMLQVGAQGGMMFTVPIYFQVTSHVSTTVAGAHLFPAVAGNTIGSLLAGFIIKRTGRYKVLSILAMILSTTCYTLLILRWKGHTSVLESLYIIPGGFGSGVAGSALFVALQAGLQLGEMAIASSGLYLSLNLGMLISLASVSAVQQSQLRTQLQRTLSGLPHSRKIIEKTLADIGYVRNLTGVVRERVDEAYVKSLEAAHGVSLISASLGFLVSLTMREHPL